MEFLSSKKWVQSCPIEFQESVYRGWFKQLKGREESGSEVRVTLLADHLDDIDHPDLAFGQQTERIRMARPLRDVNRYC